MRMHISKEVLLPLRVHLGEARPLVTKAQRGPNLSIIKIRRHLTFLQQRFSKWRKQHARNVTHDGKVDETSRAGEFVIAPITLVINHRSLALGTPKGWQKIFESR
jgi:hypothetical protein